MPATFQIGALLEPGLRSEAAWVYAQQYEQTKAEIGDVIWMEATSDKLQEVFGWLETPSYLTWWPADSPIPTASIGSARYTIINRDFGRRHVLPRNVEDDQTGTAMQFARMLAGAYSILPVEIFYQIIQNTTYNGTTAPLPAVSTAADGSALYIATTRYGSADGNVVAATSTSTVQGIITDLISVKRRKLNFQNTQGRPYWVNNEVNSMTVFHGTALTLVMQQAEFQTRVPWEVTSGANGTGQTPTNLLLQSRGLDLRYVNSQRITGSLYYTFLRGIEPAKRPIWRQVRKGYTEWQGNFVTSDYSRDTGRTYVQGDCREGYGSILAIATCRVGS